MWHFFSHTKDVKTSHPALEDGDDAEEDSVPPRPTPHQPLPPWKILVVDDSATSRKNMVSMLKRDGHAVDQTYDGLEAFYKLRFVREFQKTQYDCVILNDEMPFLSGVDVTRLLRAKGFDKVIIIGLTEGSHDDDKSAYREAGADFVVTKPLLIDMWTRIYISLRGEKGAHVHFA